MYIYIYIYIIIYGETSGMNLFTEKFNELQLLTDFTKMFVIDVSLNSEKNCFLNFRNHFQLTHRVFFQYYLLLFHLSF